MEPVKRMMTRAILDDIITSFCEAIHMRPNMTKEETFELFKPFCEMISRPLIGPFWGTLAGLVKAGRLPEWALKMVRADDPDFFNMPGYNDFLMSNWLISKSPELIPQMIARTLHIDPRVSETARWMINSIAAQNPEFSAALKAHAPDYQREFIPHSLLDSIPYQLPHKGKETLN